MIVKYDSLDRFEKPKLTLCNPGARYTDGHLTKVLGVLSDYDSEEIVFNFNSTSELNFRIYRVKHDDPDEDSHAAFLYNSIKHRRLIFVEDVGFFVISDTHEGYEGLENFIDVTAKSADAEIEQKKVPYIEDNTYPFRTQSEDEVGLLDMLVQYLPLWTIGTVDNAVAERWRTFEDVSVDENVLSFMLQEMQDAYECIFVFDIINRVIDVYDQNNYVRSTNIHLTEDDLINTMGVDSSSADVYTAISVVGGENVTIGAINPIGTNTIYDFSYYIDWMSDELGAKVRAWQLAVENNKEHYKELNLQYYTLLNSCYTSNYELQRLNTQLTIYKRMRENIVAGSSGAALNEYNKVITENGGTAIPITESISAMLLAVDARILDVKDAILHAEDSLNDYNSELDYLEKDIKEIVDSLSFTTYFTEEEYNELYYYIFEGSYNDEFVLLTSEMTPLEQFEQMQTLYDRAQLQLKRVSRPTEQFNIDVENFVFAKEFERWSEQLETGCLINVELPNGEVAALFLSNITINYDDHSLTMTFGNRFNKFDPKTLFENVLGGINRSANSINYLKDTVYPFKNGEFNAMREQIQASRDLTMDAALASENEEVTIDGSGYTGREIREDGSYDPRQVKITGKSIVFTDDAWETCKTAIGEILLGDGTSTYGINAETIIGDLIIGNQLVIKDNDGNDLFTIIDNRVTSGVSSIDARVSKTIKDTDFTYCLREVGTSPAATDTDWTTVFPTERDGKRIWRKTVLTLEDGTRVIKAIEDITGADGTSGDDGLSVKSIAYEYCLSGSDKVITWPVYPSTETIVDTVYPSVAEWAPEWSENIPPYIAGYYYWKRVITTYTDDTQVIGEPFVDYLLSTMYTSITTNSTRIDQTDREISLVANRTTTVAQGIADLDSKIDNSIKKVTENIASLNITADQITAEVAQTVREGIDRDYKYARTWLNQDGLNIATSASTTESLIDGTGLEVREVIREADGTIAKDENGNEKITTIMKAKGGEVEAARFKATETFTYDSGKGYTTTMKVYYSSVDQESGIGWYWRELPQEEEGTEVGN